METVLITGGCGFIGSNTARKMLTDGYRVVVVDEMNDYYDPVLKRDNLRHLHDVATASQQGFVFYETDIADLAEMTKIFEREQPSLVIHLAARAGVRYSIEDPQVYAHSNVMGTTTILELSQRFKVRSVAMASSSSVYGDRPDKSQQSWINERADADDASRPTSTSTNTADNANEEEEEEEGAFRETDAVNMPASPYAATKRATELLAYTYSQLYKMPIACLRFFTVYGPGGRPDMAPHKFIHRILHGIPIDRYGDGSAIRDFTYVDDIVDGIVLSLLKPQGYQIYNLGGGRPISLAKFITLCEDAVGKKAVINVMPTQPGDVARTHASVTKARKMLGFKAKVHVADGLKRMADWYKEFIARKQALNKPANGLTRGDRDHDFDRPTSSNGSDSGFSGDTSNQDAIAQSVESLNDLNMVEEITEKKLVVCSRIHSMRSLSEERKQRVVDMVNSTLSLPIPASVCIAVEYTLGPGGDRLFKEVEKTAFGAAESDLTPEEARRLVHILPIMNWGMTVALNACVQHADSMGSCYTTFCSLEVAFDSQVMSVLLSECDLGNTLVAGACLPGHEFCGQGKMTVDASGTTTPWNTLAVWNTAKLATIGFVHIGNGSKVLNMDAGIEEVSTASVIQGIARSAGLPVPHVKLIKMPNEFNMKWRNNFQAMDPQRQEKHVKKMKFKNHRAQAHMDVLGSDPARITHIVHCS